MLPTLSIQLDSTKNNIRIITQGDQITPVAKPKHNKKAKGYVNESHQQKKTKETTNLTTEEAK